MNNSANYRRSGGFLKKMFFFTGIVTFIVIMAAIIAKALKEKDEIDLDDDFFEDGFEDDEPDECGYAHDKDFEKE